MDAVSLFTGAGGLDLGVEAAGLNIRAAVEKDNDCVETIRINRNWRLIERDIHTVSSSEILERAELDVGEIDLLFAGPPCQPFSKSGYWDTGDTDRLDDPRATTLEKFLAVVRDTKPQAFLLENVPGLGYKGKDEGLELLKRVVSDINEQNETRYKLHFEVLNALQFGVPQGRERLFVVAHRQGKDFKFPDPTHGEEDGHLEPFRKAWDALGDLEVNASEAELKVTGKWSDLLPSIPEGENYLYHTERGGGEPLFGWRRRFWNFLLKLAKDRHSWTITARPGSATGPFHWENRRLSKREMARLQTFPDEYRFAGSRRSVQRQIGNAVPVAMAHKVGQAVARQFFEKNAGATGPSKYAPPARRPIPAPVEPEPVPEKYLCRKGEHDPHPGEGKGPGVKAS